MIKENTTFEWVIWTIIVSVSAIILLFSLGYYLYIYRKEKKKVITLEKIPIFGMFLAIFIVQAYFTRIFPHTSEIIPISLDDITIITIGFLFGPIEAILYGSIADITRTLINGWGFQIISFFIFPLTGLIAGVFGRAYIKNKNKPIDKIEKSFNYKYKYNTEILLVLITVASFFWLSNFTLNLSLVTMYVYILISLIFLLLIIIWIRLKKWDKKNEEIMLLFFVTLTIILSRIFTGYIIRPFAQHFYFNYNWLAEVNLRIVTSSYLIPIKIFVGFYFVKASFYAYSITK